MMVAPFASLLTWLFGGWSQLFGAVLLFIVLDYITGVVDAGVHGQLNPKTGFYGILKKVLYFVPVALAHAIDQIVGPGFIASNQPIQTIVLWFILANEGISILGHLGSLGVPVPGVLKTAIESLRDKGPATQNTQPPGGGNGK